MDSPPIEVDISLRDDIEEFLISAQSASNSSEKIQWCETIEEHLLKRTDVDESERTALLHEFVKPIMELHLNSSKEVKLFVINFAQSIAIEYFEHLKDVLPSFSFLCQQEENDQVLSKLLQSGVHIYRRSLRYIADTSERDDTVEMYTTLIAIKEALLQQMNSKTDKNRSAAIKFVECIVLSHSDLTKDDVNMVKTSAKNKRLDDDGADTFHLRYVPMKHGILKKDEMRVEGRTRLQDLVRRCCATCGTKLILKKKSGYSGNQDNEDDDDDEDDAPQVEYDVDFSTKNFIVAINSFCNVGSHRSKLVDIIFPGMLSIHSGLYHITSNGKKSAASIDGGSSEVEPLWNAKQAKSLSNMNKNNMLKMLKFTTSVPWHEELVVALTELGFKEQAERARELSAEGATRVGGKRSKNEPVDIEPYKRHKIEEEYTGPWPPKQSVYTLPKDFNAGLTTNQIVQLVIQNMKHLPPPPPPNVFPGEPSLTSASAKESLKMLTRVLDRMVKFPKIMHAIPTEAPTTLFHRGPPLRTPDMAIFDRKDHAGGIVEPYKRLMRANIILEEMKSNIISRRDKNSTQRNNKHLNDLRSTHARFMGRLLGIAQTLNTVEKRDSDNEASSSSNSPSSSPSVDSAKTDDPSGLMSVLIELVGKMNTTDIPEDIIFDIVISALYRTFQDEISSIKAKDSELTSMSTSDNRYTRFLVQLMRAMPMNEKRVKLQEPRLTRLLLACPMVPNIVLREVMDHWCEEAAVGGDIKQLEVGLVTLRELILRRSALRNVCLRAVFNYTSGGMPAKLSEITVKMITLTLYSKDDIVDNMIIEYVKNTLAIEPMLLNKAMSSREDALDPTQANQQSRQRLIFFEKLCRKHPPLINVMLKCYVTVRESEELKATQGAIMFCTWVEEMAPKLAVNAVTFYKEKYIVEDKEEEAAAAAAAAAAAEEGDNHEGEKVINMVLEDDVVKDENDENDDEKKDEERKEKPLPIVRGAVAVADLLKKSPKKALKPIVFILKSMTQPSLAWKGPPPELVKEMHSLFDIFDSNFWILTFALPGMSKNEAIDVVQKIVNQSKIEKGKGAMSKGAQIMRTALETLLNPADLSFAPVTPSELMVCLHSIGVTDDGKMSTKANMAAIDYCLKTELKERYTTDVLKRTMVELMKVDGDGTKLSKLLLRSLIQSVDLRPDLKSHALDMVLQLCELKIWETNADVWKGVPRLLNKFGDDSYPTLMKMPTNILTELLNENKKMATRLSAYVKLSMDFDSKAKYHSATIKMLETWK